MPTFANDWSQIKQVPGMSNFHPLEAVGRGSFKGAKI